MRFLWLVSTRYPPPGELMLLTASLLCERSMLQAPDQINPQSLKIAEEIVLPRVIDVIETSYFLTKNSMYIGLCHVITTSSLRMLKVFTTKIKKIYVV